MLHSSKETKTNEPKMPISVSIVEDSRGTRESLSELLKRSPGLRCVGAYPNGEAALRELPEQTPDVVLMDIGLSRLNGIDATRRIKDLLPDTIIIGLSVHSVGQIERAMLVAGASAFFSKDVSPEELVAKIRSTVKQRFQSHTNV